MSFKKSLLTGAFKHCDCGEQFVLLESDSKDIKSQIYCPKCDVGENAIVRQSDGFFKQCSCGTKMAFFYPYDSCPDCLVKQ